MYKKLYGLYNNWFSAKSENSESQDESTNSNTDTVNTEQPQSQFVCSNVYDQSQSTSKLHNVDATRTPTNEQNQYPLNDNLLSLSL